MTQASYLTLVVDNGPYVRGCSKNCLGQMKLVAGTAFNGAAGSDIQTTEELFHDLFGGDMSVYHQLASRPDPYTRT